MKAPPPISPGFIELIVQNNAASIWNIVESYPDTPAFTSVQELYEIVWDAYYNEDFDRVYAYLNAPFLINGSEPFTVTIDGTKYGVEGNVAHPVLINYFDGAGGLPNQSIISLSWPSFSKSETFSPLQQSSPLSTPPAPPQGGAGFADPLQSAAATGSAAKVIDWNTWGIVIALFIVGLILIFLWTKK
jgi:hypothetical protein